MCPLGKNEFTTLSEKTQCPVHLMSEKVQGNLSQCFHTNENRVKKEFPTEKHFLRTSTIFCRFSDLDEAARTVLEEQRYHLFQEAKSEILKQECKVDKTSSFQSFGNGEPKLWV